MELLGPRPGPGTHRRSRLRRRPRHDRSRSGRAARDEAGGARSAPHRARRSIPGRVPVEAMRHGADEGGRFLAAYTSPDTYHQFGPQGSDAIELPARDIFSRAEAAGERVVIDPGAPAQIEVPAAVLPFLAAGIDPTTPEAMRARRPHGELPPLEAPAEVPQPFGGELQRELAELAQVDRAWLLRAGTGWTVGDPAGPGSRPRAVRRGAQPPACAGQRAPGRPPRAGGHRPRAQRPCARPTRRWPVPGTSRRRRSRRASWASCSARSERLARAPARSGP